MKTQHAFVLLILGFASCTTFIISVKFLPLYVGGSTAYDVRIINGFTSNSSLALVVWCASDRKGDIGGRALQERDEYGWIIADGPFRSSSRFVCTVKWAGKRKKFEAFKASRDKYRCGSLGQCFWLVKEDGFYFGNDGVNWIKDFPWI